MADHAAILDLYLGQAYAAKNLGKGRLADVERLMANAAAASADLRAEMERRHALYSSVASTQCVITANHLSLLEKVLKEVRA